MRLSAFDYVPYRAGEGGVGEPEPVDGYPYAFGGDGTGHGIDLTEAHRFCDLLTELGCTSLQGFHLGRPCPAAEFAARLA